MLNLIEVQVVKKNTFFESITIINKSEVVLQLVLKKVYS